MIRAVPGERVHGGPRGSGRRIAVTLAAMGGGAALLAALWWANTPSGQGSAGRGLATARPPVETAAPAPPDPALEAFLAGLRPEAAAKGIGAASLERAFQGLRLDPQVGELAANQPEHVKPVGEYLALLVSPERIAAGRQQLAERADLLARIEAAYGVDRHVLLAVWGIESNYGTAMGSRGVIRSLTTLAIADPRRPQFWRGELIAALKILDSGDITAERMAGSWAGAMGHTQFMPSTFLAYAVDFDKDGRRDIWGNVADALASTANYLKASGWRTGDPWGFEVVLPAGFDYALSAPGNARAPAAWTRLGVTAPGGVALPAIATDVQLLLPAGARGPAFLTAPGFRAILRYNPAVAYALAVAHLADRIRGGAPFAAAWPEDDKPLARPEREELQRRLAQRGFDTGGVDGLIGANTRAAIRIYQKAIGLAADGHPSPALLEGLRREDAR